MNSIEIIIGLCIVAPLIVAILVTILLQLGIITEHKGMPIYKSPPPPPVELCTKCQHKDAYCYCLNFNTKRTNETN